MCFLPQNLKQQLTSTDQRSDLSPNKLKELTTSSETTPTIDEKADEDTVSAVEHSYIIENNNIADDELADKVVIEVDGNQSQISTQSWQEMLFVPWSGQEWLEFMLTHLFIAFSGYISTLKRILFLK